MLDGLRRLDERVLGAPGTPRARRVDRWLGLDGPEWCWWVTAAVLLVLAWPVTALSRPGPQTASEVLAGSSGIGILVALAVVRALAARRRNRG